MLCESTQWRGNIAPSPVMNVNAHLESGDRMKSGAPESSFSHSVFSLSLNKKNQYTNKKQFHLPVTLRQKLFSFLSLHITILRHSTADQVRPGVLVGVLTYCSLCSLKSRGPLFSQWGTINLITMSAAIGEWPRTGRAGPLASHEERLIYQYLCSRQGNDNGVLHNTMGAIKKV